MQIQFPNLDAAQVVDRLHENLQGRKLGDLVQVELFREHDLRILIQKMGTSTLEFTHAKKGSVHTWTLTQEKLAFAHRAFKPEMLRKIEGLITELGGSFTA